MRIESADVVVTSPGRNFVTLKLTTSDGVVGLGDATVNGRELAVASYLRDHVAALLVGREANNIEDTWQYLYRGASTRRGTGTARCPRCCSPRGRRHGALGHQGQGRRDAPVPAARRAQPARGPRLRTLLGFDRRVAPDVD